MDDRHLDGCLCHCGTTYGIAEETLAFYGLIIAVMIAAGYDSLTGVAVVMGGLALGRVDYDKWIKFTLPLLIILLLLYAIVLSVGVLMPGQIF